MKLSYEDKLEIYKLEKNGVSWAHLNQTYDVTTANLKYMIKLMDRYGVEIVEKGKNRYDSPELKQEIMYNVLIHGRSQLSVSLDYALPNRGMLPNWIAQLKNETLVREQQKQLETWSKEDSD